MEAEQAIQKMMESLKIIEEPFSEIAKSTYLEFIAQL
jgi:hypothetical protein